MATTNLRYLLKPFILCSRKFAPGWTSGPFLTSFLISSMLDGVTLVGYVRTLATCTGTATCSWHSVITGWWQDGSWRPPTAWTRSPDQSSCLDPVIWLYVQKSPHAFLKGCHGTGLACLWASGWSHAWPSWAACSMGFLRSRCYTAVLPAAAGSPSLPAIQQWINTRTLAVRTVLHSLNLQYHLPWSSASSR